MDQYTAQAVVIGRDFANTVLAAMKTVPGGALIVTGKVRLSQDPAFNPTPASTRAGLAAGEADYSGYAAGGIAYVVPDPVNLDTETQGLQVTVAFVATAANPFVENTIYGWWIDDGTNVVVAEKFANDATANFGAAGDFLSLNTRVPFMLEQNAS